MTGLSGISSYNFTGFSAGYSSKKTTGFARKTIQGKSQPDFFVRQKEDAEAERTKESRHLHKIIRELKRKWENDGENIQEKLNKELTTCGRSTENDKKEKVKSHVNYNYKEVAGKIQRAKTSVSAGQAVISAKRKVVEIKRKISTGDGDAEDLQLALTHAKRMEMAARKKKHHLEMEEMAANNIQRDENASRQEETVKAIRDSLVNAAEEDVSKQEDEIFENREALAEELSEYAEETGEGCFEDMVSELNEMISELDEETLEELEKAMEFFEDMEILNPHMTREDLDELKCKHRAEEQKALLKADMDYLKGMIKHQMNRSDGIMGMKGNSLGYSASFPSGGMMTAGVSVAAPTVSAGIDVQV